MLDKRKFFQKTWKLRHVFRLSTFFSHSWKSSFLWNSLSFFKIWKKCKRCGTNFFVNFDIIHSVAFMMFSVLITMDYSYFGLLFRRNTFIGFECDFIGCTGYSFFLFSWCSTQSMRSLWSSTLLMHVRSFFNFSSKHNFYDMTFRDFLSCWSCSL